MRCENPRHDHWSTTDAATGADLATPVAMSCGDCHQPTHYDRDSESYEHDDPAAAGCFLIPQPHRRATPCTRGGSAATPVAG
jgi:hypothetical protein